MTPKHEIEAALRKAIDAVILECVIEDYMAETGAEAVVLARVRDIYARLA